MKINRYCQKKQLCLFSWKLNWTCDWFHKVT